MGDTPKIKLALLWCSGCGGCDAGVLDLAEDLLEAAQRFEIVFWPLVMDTKLERVEKFKSREIDLAMINGAIRTEEHVELVRLFRQKSKRIVAHGACAHLGGVVGLGNLAEPALPTAANGPSLEHMPRLTPRALALSQVVRVDHVIPGCPPPPELVRSALEQLGDPDRPPRPGVLAPEVALCQECPRRESGPIRRPPGPYQPFHLSRVDPEQCFLSAGVVCLGPVTRAGCRAQCLAAQKPCQGCFGPPQALDDQGARAVSLLASLIRETDPEKMARAAEGIPDPVGLVYRYSLAVSRLGGPGRP